MEPPTDIAESVFCTQNFASLTKWRTMVVKQNSLKTRNFIQSRYTNSNELDQNKQY